jgi:hypothetical protein
VLKTGWLGGGRIPLLGQAAEVELLLRLSAELAAEQRSLLPVDVDGTSDAGSEPADPRAATADRF